MAHIFSTTRVLNLFIEGEDDFPVIPEPPKPEPPPKPPRKPRTVKAYTYDSKTGKETVHKR